MEVKNERQIRQEAIFKRYKDDPRFHRIVKSFFHGILDGLYTAMDIKDSLMAVEVLLEEAKEQGIEPRPIKTQQQIDDEIKKRQFFAIESLARYSNRKAVISDE